MNIANAGVGRPIKLVSCFVSTLNFARRIAEHNGVIEANRKGINKTPCSWVSNILLNSLNKIIAGAIPKVTMSANESSCFPISL